jgi:hypothetical protein
MLQEVEEQQLLLLLLLRSFLQVPLELLPSLLPLLQLLLAGQ